MRRRAFLSLLGGGAATLPVTARAQQPRKLPTIGFLGQSTPVAESSRLAAFLERLRELGWIDGQTVAIEYGWAEGVGERFAEIARRFVQIKVDVIVTSGTASVVSAKQATTVIPIVLRWPAILSPTISSLACPGRAATSPACLQWPPT